MMLTGLASGAYTMFFGSFISDQSILIILIPIIVVPLMLLSGWFVKTDSSITVLWPFQWISSYKYCFNSLIRVMIGYKLIERIKW